MAAREKIRLAMFLTGVAAVAGPFGYMLEHYLSDQRDPIEAFLSVEALNSPVRPGDGLEVEIHRIKVRDDCPVTSIRTAVDQNGRQWAIPTGINLEGGSPDADTFRTRYPIPKELPPGRYEMRVHLIYDCKEKSFHHDQPSILFCVVAIEPDSCKEETDG